MVKDGFEKVEREPWKVKAVGEKWKVAGGWYTQALKGLDDTQFTDEEQSALPSISILRA